MTVGRRRGRRGRHRAGGRRSRASHTATHLVHAGMRNALGDAAAQAGSLNAPGRLRFDFTSPAGAVPSAVLADVEDEVNDVLLNDHEVQRVRHHAGRGPPDRRDGAVRREVRRPGAGGRRSATTPASCAAAPTCAAPASSAWSSCSRRRRSAPACAGSRPWSGWTRSASSRASTCSSRQLAEQFKARPEELPDRVGGVVERLRTAERDLEKVRADAVLSSAGALAAAPRTWAAPRWSRPQARPGSSPDDLRALAVDVRGRLGDPAGGRRAVRRRRRREGRVRRRHHRRRPRRRAGGGQARAGVRGRRRRPRRRQARPGPGRRHRPVRGAGGDRRAAPGAGRPVNR